MSHAVTDGTFGQLTDQRINFLTALADLTGKFLILMVAGLSEWVKERGDYKILRCIGTGASGEANLCVEVSTNQQVAVKALPHVQTFRDSQCFLREIMCMLRLQSFGVPKFYGFCLPGQNDKETEPALVIMEYFPNGNLHSLVERKKAGSTVPQLCSTTIMKIIFGVASTMAHIHEQGIIHRDLKPENVFLDGHFEPVVADFGLSRPLLSTTVRCSVGIGSPMFMAPEVFNDGERPYSAAVDVWSFGVFIYDIFATDLEFEDGHPIKNAQQMMLRIMRGARFKRVDGIPDALWDLMLTCWDTDPLQRPTFAQIVDKLKRNDGMVLPGTDLEKLREYQERAIAAGESAAKLVETRSIRTEIEQESRRGEPQNEARSFRATRFSFTRQTKS
jgi:serine/threonine protein kinase